MSHFTVLSCVLSATGGVNRGCEKRDHLLQEDRCSDPGHCRKHEWLRLSTLHCE